MRENAGTTLNLLEGCLEHGAGLVYPSTVRAAVEPPPDEYALSKRLGEIVCRLHPRAGRPSCVSRRSSVRASSSDDGATGAIAWFAAKALAGEPIVIPGDPERARDFVYVDDAIAALERIVADGRWNETHTVASGVATPLLRAAELVVAAAGSSARDRDAGRGAPARRERELQGRRAARFFRPAPRRSYSCLCRLARVPLLKAAPEREQIADRLDGGDWRGLELCLAGKHVASDDAVEEAIRVSAGLGVAGHGRVPGRRGRAARSSASTGWTTRRAPASTAAPASPPRSGRRC